MSSNRITLWLGLAAMALAMAGCSGESDPPAAASILSFQSSPSEIESGRSATLAWETRNAQKVEIVEVGGGPIALGDVSALRGSVLVSPTQTTEYELRATGKGGGVASEVTTIHVIPATDAPAILSFVASPEHVTRGDEVVLSWMTTGADTVRISDATGTTLASLDGEKAAAGEFALKPHSSTTYHLLAKGKGGETEAQVSVSVHGQPAVTLRAPVEPVQPGGAAILQWTASQADHVTISDESGAVLYDGDDVEGQVTVHPNETTVYTAIARNPTAEGSARATVAVQPVVELFQALAERPVYPGEQVELRWKVLGAKAVEISRLGLETWVAPDEARGEGSVLLPVGEDGSFRLRARSGSLTTEALASVTLQAVPRIQEFSVSPTVVSADPDHPATVTLSWFVDGASRLTIETDGGEKISVAGYSPRKDSIEAQVRGTTTFRLTAINEHGASVAEREVTAHKTPSIDRFVALPAVAAVGEEIQLFWETSDATEVTLEKVGIGPIGTALPVDGSVSDTILTESSYVLKTRNALGHETVSEPIAVAIGGPSIVRFEADRFFVRPGLPVTLTWQNVGGQAISITDSSGAAVLDLEGKTCSTADPFRIAAGSCVIPGPAVGEHTLTLTLRNGLNPPTEVMATVEMESVSGPVITSFAVEGSPNSVGEPLTFRWTTTEDIDGNGGLVELSADGEVFHTTTEPALSGTLAHAFTTPGNKRITLRAFSANGEHSRTVHVDIRGLATVDRFEASPNRLDSTVGALATELSWDFQFGRTARIHEVAADGSLVEPALLVLDSDADTVTGARTLDVTPGIHDYVLVVDNGAGSRDEARVRVQADLVEASIVASVTDAMPGNDTVTLSWETKHASEIFVTPLVLSESQLPTAREIDAPFFDIQRVEGAVEHPATNKDNGYADIQFPEGFAFPFDGKVMAAARVWVDGAISFDFTGAGNGSNAAFPTRTGSEMQKRAHLAPFWGNLELKVDNSHPWGKIFSGMAEDEKGPFFVIQWSGVHAWSSNARPSDFNFQTILRPNGTWEYRYGSMTSRDDYATGRFVTIGYQNLDATVGHTFSHSTPIGFGPAFRSWAYEPPALQATGSMDVAVSKDTTFTIWARNDYSAASDSTEKVVFWQKPVVSVSAAEEILVGSDVTLTWSATHASKVEIFESSQPGTVLCQDASADGSQVVLEGTCVVRPTEGLHTYVVRAVGGHPANVTEKQVSTKVYRPFRLVSFGTEADLLNPTESTTLSWSSEGAAVWELTANGQPVAISQSDSGTVTVTPETTTVYVLTIRDQPTGGLPVRSLSESVRVVVKTNSLDEVTTTRTQFAAGTGAQTVTIGWGTTGADGVQIGGVVAHDEIAGVPFVDIRRPETALTRTHGNLDEGGYVFELPAGFSFVYGGEAVAQVAASTNGWLSFEPTVPAGWVGANIPLPATANAGLHMFPFWDDLDDSLVYMDLGLDDELGPFVVIQWDAKIKGASSGRLNFQVVLFASGVWEYRFGSMQSNYLGRADGSSATIGYQSRGATSSHSISTNKAVPNGLSSRSYRYNPNQVANGSVDIELSGTSEIEVCSFDSGYRDCKTVHVVFVEAKDLTITELMVAPVGPQWIEVRNISSNTLDLAGFQLKNATGDVWTFEAQRNLRPGEFAVVAAGEGVDADQLYTGVSFSPAADTVTFALDGTVIDSVAWDATWELPTTGSLELDGLHHVREDLTGVTLENRWCASTEQMGGGVFGTPGYLGAGCVANEYAVDWLSHRPFIDISATGESIEKLNSDSGYDKAGEGRAIGFPFRFFGTEYTEWYGSANGLISFNPLTEAYNYGVGQLPRTSGATQAIVAAFWQNLLSQQGSSVKTALLDSDGQQVRVVQWTGMAVSGTGISGRITFQIQLWSGGDIVLGYKDIYAPAGSLPRFLGGSTSIGIQKEDRSRALALPYNKPWLVFDGKVMAFEAK